VSDGLSQDELRDYFPFGFATSDEAWQRHTIDALLPPDQPFAGESVRYAVRQLAQLLAKEREHLSYKAPEVRAERLLALGALTDALRFVARRYLQTNPDAVLRGRIFAERKIGEDIVAGVNHRFGDLYPPGEVQLHLTDVERFLERPQIPGHVTVELILLFLAMRNPATRPYRELFDDQELQRHASYVPYVVALEEFFGQEPPGKDTGTTLFHALRAPMLASPDSLEGQLTFIREHWADFLPQEMLARLDLARDLLREEDAHRGVGTGRPPVLEFGPGTAGAYDGYPEPESFSRDADWMSNVVLIAKSTYVWLDQLARKYGREISRLDQIPDEELDRLARWGIDGLWLIGLWERSRASRTIKQWTGNPDAVASAYSLLDYSIAADLGGEGAYRDLKERAARRGIRLASDMVPNHMAIDSRWVVEHPDWFLQLDRPPYPAYQYSCDDLCDHPDVAVRIEDGYWERRDAAVVFQRVDNRSGETRYIYHGNDGTSMPWNDTAQLDFTRADVREAVVQTILHVARMFPIIRFDAAMTLAKKHFQRLWFPAPGDAGAIPSRAEHGMSRERFDEVFPVEFWRDVVDRVAAEVPDTLLLAEAFWLMEGYFVRTLGMHRVYNSAFMNMLKMEENQKYRQTVKNVLAFSPEVLKRFVNFMNNPDERTAVEQFGKGDKYFGVAVLMVTMPGLPMFGHGQIEGFAEKYGMEYQRAYWDEPVDEEMVRRHERDVFPLLHRRALFSGAEHFAIFDFVDGHGQVDENVFATTNRHGGERALVLYNNAYAATAGRIHTASAVNTGPADAPVLVRRSLSEALGLRVEEGIFYAFRDLISGQEYLRHSRELADGFYAELGAYQYHVFLDWRELSDQDRVWTTLHGRLGGRPVPDLWRARREIELEPLLRELERDLGEVLGGIELPAEAADEAETGGLEPARSTAAASEPADDAPPAGDEVADAAPASDEVDDAPPAGDEVDDAVADAAVDAAVDAEVDSVTETVEEPHLARSYAAAPTVPLPILTGLRGALRRAAYRLADRPVADAASTDTEAPAPRPGDADLLVDRAGAVLVAWSPDTSVATAAWLAVRLAGLLAWRPGLIAARAAGAASALIRGLPADPLATAYLGINHHDGHHYLHRETLEQWLAAEALLTSSAGQPEGSRANGTGHETAPDRGAAEVAAILRIAERCSYRLDEIADELG